MPSHTSPRLDLLALKPALPAGQDSELTLLARIHLAEPQAPAGARPPLNLSLVIDRSGSMGGEPLEMARQAAKVALRALQPHDRVSVVTFDDEIDLLIASQLVQDPAALCRRIDTIVAGGSTALHAGWLDGALQVAQHLDPEALNRVLLLTDGQANVGKRRISEIVGDVQGLTRRGVSTSTIGLGDGYEEDLLRAMADAGDGNFEHIENASALPAYFDAELSGLQRTTGHTVSLGVEPNPALGSLRSEVLNDLPRNSYGRAQLPNLVAGRTIDLVITLHVPAQSVADTLGVTRLRLAWTGRDGVRRTLRQQLDLPVIEPDAYAELVETGAVRVALELQRNAQAKRDAIRHLDAGDVLGARQLIQDRAVAFSAMPMPAAMQVEEASQFESLLEDDPNLARKRAVSQNYDRSRSKR